LTSEVLFAKILSGRYQPERIFLSLLA